MAMLSNWVLHSCAQYFAICRKTNHIYIKGFSVNKATCENLCCTGHIITCKLLLLFTQFSIHFFFRGDVCVDNLVCDAIRCNFNSFFSQKKDVCIWEAKLQCTLELQICISPQIKRFGKSIDNGHNNRYSRKWYTIHLYFTVFQIIINSLEII